MPKGISNILSAGLFALGTLPAAAAELVMVEQAGCHYCELWHAQIGPVYPKTSLSEFAPLSTMQLTETRSQTATELARPVVFTPTFLLVEEGREIARLEGYPGEDFFWPLIEKIVADHTPYDPSLPSDTPPQSF